MARPKAVKTEDVETIEDYSLKQRAVGVHKVGVGKYEVVVIAYDPDSKKAVIEKTYPCETRLDASHKFRTTAVELDLV